MERLFEKPLLEPDALCIYRRPGSVKGWLVRAGRWGGGTLGVRGEAGGLVYHRFMQTVPNVGPGLGVSDQYLAGVPQGDALAIAAAFVEQLADDAAIVGDAAKLTEAAPTLAGEVRVDVLVPTGEPWRWVAAVNGVEAAAVQDDWHVGALRDLASILTAKAPYAQPDVLSMNR